MNEIHCLLTYSIPHSGICDLVPKSSASLDRHRPWPEAPSVCLWAHASITCVRDLEPKVFSPLWEIAMACDQKAGARGWHTEGAPACPCCCPSCSLLALSPPSPHVRDSPEVGPGVITGYLLPPYKSNRLFGLVRLKLTYQPAAVLYISLNLYLGENLWPGIAFCKMIKVAKQP